MHEFDAVPWLLDSAITEVSRHAPRPTGSLPAGQEFQDPQLILLRTADGVLSTIEVFLNARYGYDVRCDIVGEQGVLAVGKPVTMIADRNRGRTVGYAAD